MAILANRVKINRDLSNVGKLLVSTCKRSFSAILIVVAICLLCFARPGRYLNFMLEVTGTLTAKSLIIYEQLFAPLNFLAAQFIYLKDLKTENLSLKLTLAKLTALESEIAAIKAENLALRKLLNVAFSEQHKHTVARLLSLSLNPFSQSALVAAGAKQGIEVDQIITSAEGLVGRIVEVSDNYARVLLLGDANFRVPILTSISQERGILTGNNKPQIIYLQKRHAVKQGEIVITSGDGLIYPYGIPVARVSAVNEYEVLVKPLMNLRATSFVKIHGKNKL